MIGLLSTCQLGHMRTNKNCPKYGDLDTNTETPDLEKVPGKSTSLNPSGPSQIKTVTKKLIPKSATKIALVEASEGENLSPSTKVVPLKFKCSSTDNVSDKFTLGLTKITEQPVTSDPETGKSTVKVNKIIISNKPKTEDVHVGSQKLPIVIRPPADTDKGQGEVQKPTIVIRPPANTERDRVESHKISRRLPIETEREQLHKKIIIKRPKEVIDLDQFSQDGGTGIEHRKTKRIVELSSFEVDRNQETMHSAQTAKKKAKDKRKWWEEQEKHRNEERLREERARRLHEEEMRMLEEQERLARIKRYETAMRREREEEERQKAKKKKKKIRAEMRDDYMEDSRSSRFDKRMPERDRSAKRRPVVDYAATTKRRRGGEVIYHTYLYSRFFLCLCCFCISTGDITHLSIFNCRR